MVGREGNRRIVVAADLAAQVLGIRLGTPATKAQALVAELVIQDADPDGDRAGLERLAVWALRYSPIVAADPPTAWSWIRPAPTTSTAAKTLLGQA